MKKVEQKLEEVSLFEDGKSDTLDVAPVVKVTPEEKPSFEMPDKFKGKSIEDVVESYINVEKALGNKANEVGELRKLTDQILLNQAQPQQPVVEANINNDVGFNDFVEDPAIAVDKVLANNPRLRQMEETIEANATEVSRKALLVRHEDADSVVTSPEFQTWLAESPTRTRMLQEAHVNRDVATASDLLDMYKTTRQVATENAIDERDAIAKSDLRKATVEVGTVPAITKKVYLRTELIQLKITNPQRYAAMSSEINAAYAEGRVK